jgi:hypothetical protein
MEYSPKQVEQRRRGMIKHRYGLTIEQYDIMLASQGGVCAICGQPPLGIRLAVDHDHDCCPGRNSCGQCIRGLICQRCNGMLGYIESNNLLGPIIKFLRGHKRRYWKKMEEKYGHSNREERSPSMGSEPD